MRGRTATPCRRRSACSGPRSIRALLSRANARATIRPAPPAHESRARPRTPTARGAVSDGVARPPSAWRPRARRQRRRRARRAGRSSCGCACRRHPCDDLRRDPLRARRPDARPDRPDRAAARPRRRHARGHAGGRRRAGGERGGMGGGARRPVEADRQVGRRHARAGSSPPRSAPAGSRCWGRWLPAATASSSRSSSRTASARCSSDPGVAAELRPEDLKPEWLSGVRRAVRVRLRAPAGPGRRGREAAAARLSARKAASSPSTCRPGARSAPSEPDRFLDAHRRAGAGRRVRDRARARGAWRRAGRGDDRAQARAGRRRRQARRTRTPSTRRARPRSSTRPAPETRSRRASSSAGSSWGSRRPRRCVAKLGAMP